MSRTHAVLTSRILDWYKAHKRSLPWRTTRNPYCILISEVMLQQTQVDRVISKYLSFVTRFPTIEALSKAKSADVIREWKGLGYNRRALFLQRTAQAVMNEHGGVFPKNIKELKKLPGIGDYTARAILSFAFLEKVPMMDTNHRKFYSRIHGAQIQDAELLQEAEKMIVHLTKKETYLWNQALMDFMSAIARKENDATIVWFTTTYPPLEPVNKKKKTTIRFEDTDRYVRGRIIDALREKEHISSEKLRKELAIESGRFGRVIAGLLKDGLIKKSRNGMMLP